MAAMIADRDKTEIRRVFASALTGPVRLVAFVRRASALIVPGRSEAEQMATEMSRHLETLLGELASCSEKLTVEAHDLAAEPDVARTFRVDKAPALAIVGAKDYGVRYFGLPSGYEFGALIADIIDVSRGTTALSAATKTALAALTHDVHVQVFVTPT